MPIVLGGFFLVISVALFILGIQSLAKYREFRRNSTEADATVLKYISTRNGSTPYVSIQDNGVTIEGPARNDHILRDERPIGSVVRVRYVSCTDSEPIIEVVRTIKIRYDRQRTHTVLFLMSLLSLVMGVLQLVKLLRL